MMPRLVATLTTETYGAHMKFVARCTHPDCPEPPKRRHDNNLDMAKAFYEGYFRQHVLETGHTVVVEVEG